MSNTNIWYNDLRDLPQDIRRDIKIEMQIQSKLGKKTYKDVWVGSGWISLDNSLSDKFSNSL